MEIRSTVPGEISRQGAQKTSAGNEAPSANVIAHIDATEGTVEPFLAARIDDFEKVKTEAPSKLNIAAQIYRAGETPAQKIKKGLLNLGAHLAIPAAGFAIGGLVGLGVGLAVDAGLFVLGLTRQGLGSFFSGLTHRKSLPEPDWHGRRTYTITPDQTPSFDSKPTSVNDAKGLKPNGVEFSRFVSDNIKKYPSATSVIFMGGHGFGYRQVAGMTVKQVSTALQMAEADSQKKPDVIVMESCLMGNMEAMNELKGRAKVAVVSEETISATALPLKDMLLSVANEGGTPQEIGKRMVELAGRTGNVETIAAIDLDKMEPVAQALDGLGSSLLKELGNGKKADLQKAVKAAMKFPQGKMMFLERLLINFSDLGEFLKALEKGNFSDETRAGAEAVRKAVDGAVIAKASSQEYKTFSGLSFQSKVSAFIEKSPDMGSFQDLDLPKSWKTFVNSLWVKDRKS